MGIPKKKQQLAVYVKVLVKLKYEIERYIRLSKATSGSNFLRDDPLVRFQGRVSEMKSGGGGGRG